MAKAKLRKLRLVAMVSTSDYNNNPTITLRHGKPVENPTTLKDAFLAPLVTLNVVPSVYVPQGVCYVYETDGRTQGPTWVEKLGKIK